MPEQWGRPTWMVDGIGMPYPGEPKPDLDPSDVILIIICAIVTGICIGLILWKIFG